MTGYIKLSFICDFIGFKVENSVQAVHSLSTEDIVLIVNKGIEIEPRTIHVKELYSNSELYCTDYSGKRIKRGIHTVLYRGYDLIELNKDYYMSLTKLKEVGIVIGGEVVTEEAINYFTTKGFIDKHIETSKVG